MKEKYNCSESKKREFYFNKIMEKKCERKKGGRGRVEVT
jgi:hypothetical protein